MVKHGLLTRAAALAAFALCLFACERREPVVAVKVDAVNDSAAPAGSFPSGAGAVRLHDSPAPASVSGSQEPLEERIRRLTATGKPSDLFEAYKIASTCALHLENKRMAAGLPAGPEGDGARKSLEGLTVGNLAGCESLPSSRFNARFDNLEAALNAGVPGAAIAFANEGPLGDLTALETRTEDPSVVAWKEKAVAHLQACAEQGDSECLLSLSTVYANGTLAGTDAAKALAYEYAFLERKRAASGVTRNDEIALGHLKRGLSASDVRAAEQEGKSLYWRCCAAPR